MNIMANFNGKSEKFSFSDEQFNTLVRDMMSLLEGYGYHPTWDACSQIVDEWYDNKSNLIKLFMQHPNYNGKFQIAFDTDFDRNCDIDGIKNFCDFLDYNKDLILVKPEPKRLHFWSYKEAESYVGRLCTIIDFVERIQKFNGYFCEVNGFNLSELQDKYKKVVDVYNCYHNAFNNNILVKSYDDDETYPYEEYRTYKEMFNKIRRVIKLFQAHTSVTVNDELAEKVNNYFPELKIVAGQKTSRAMNKFCQLVGFNKLADYNREYAKYSDAINPLKIKRHTILSIHPLDYLTMSFGNSWASCHTIDKNNLRNKGGDSYQGCYSGGTLSYMLDSTSAVFYTVDSSYDGDRYELQDKITRNMFHIGEDKIIQGRIYPQSTDGNNSTYKEYREIVQKIIADCLNVPNLWLNKKGTGECCDVIRSDGVHYRDYEHFDCCNVSYLKEDDLDMNYRTINVGHDPICPSCGETHDWEECIECKCCYENKEYCHECGCVLDEGEGYYVEDDGNYYCDDCCTYCAYHEQYEPNSYNHEYVRDYGTVCENALYNSGYFYYCEHCGNWFPEHNFDTENNCCVDCAANITNEEENEDGCEE